ncbi:MAG: isoprenylcysteine carboxylmethyltransferase family protein [Anaerolineaceae bacterium]|nr:isoprenylcysteine carboxylmethyltransferase family protein [Anaerolineaceae bacterium]
MKPAFSLYSCLLTLAIYLGLPILGWGVDDLSGFFALPQLFGYSLSILAYGLLAGFIIQRSGGRENIFSKGQNGKFIPRQRIVRVIVSVSLLALLVWLPFADRRNFLILPDQSNLRWLGLCLEIIGMGVIFWSGVALGRLYSPEVTLQKDHKLITTGLYRYIRHPRYLGGFVQGIGLSLLFRSWLGLILTAVFLAIILFRIRDEEALMAREYNQEWKSYCDRSWRLLPLIY